MAFKPAICTQCGGKITVDDSKDAGICEFCGTPFVTEKVINQYVTTNNFSGATFNVQNGVDIENLYKLARRALAADNDEEVLKYYGQIKERNPDDWEAVFYYAWYENDESIDNYIQTAFNLIGESSESVEKKAEYYLEMAVFIREHSKYNLKNRGMVLEFAEKLIASGTDEYLWPAVNFSYLHMELPFEPRNETNAANKTYYESLEARKNYNAHYDWVKSLSEKYEGQKYALVFKNEAKFLQNRYWMGDYDRIVERIKDLSRYGYTQEEVNVKLSDFAKDFINSFNNNLKKDDFNKALADAKITYPDYVPPKPKSTPESRQRNENIKITLNVVFYVIVFGFIGLLFYTEHPVWGVLSAIVQIILAGSSLAGGGTGIFMKILMALMAVFNFFIFIDDLLY